MYQQVQGKDYNPPKRDRILEWQQQQDFPICPNPDDPDACNVYKDLTFPDDIYHSISDYYEQKTWKLNYAIAPKQSNKGTNDVLHPYKDACFFE